MLELFNNKQSMMSLAENSLCTGLLKMDLEHKECSRYTGMLRFMQWMCECMSLLGRLGCTQVRMVMPPGAGGGVYIEVWLNPTDSNVPM